MHAPAVSDALPRARSAVVVPVITLGAMRRLCTLDATRIDITFAGALAVRRMAVLLRSF
jgi:hypothetical protein